jgi:hypothetical protein
MDAHASKKIHLARDPAADLDRLEPRTKGLRKSALYQALEPMLELLQSHR